MARRIAVTGGIGAGKSTVCALLKKQGYAVLDADACAHEALALPSVVEAMKSLFGESCYSESGYLNRDFVRGAIFRDVSLRQKMESIVHPVVQSIFAEKSLVAAPKSRDGWVFYEFALLFETGRQSDFDAVLLVTASEDTRIERVAETRGLQRDQVRAIVLAQTSDAVRIAGAHAVIDNSGSTSNLENSVATALEALRVKFAQS
jgi:dephospho-CoA kinase